MAPDLLGCAVLVATDPMVGRRVAVRLTEVEAYDGSNDPASHAFAGMTRRNAVMFGPPGHLYVYFTYGMHYCVNLVCGPAGRAAAVLLRAGEVLEGLETARDRRPGVDRDAALARGPANLVRTLGLGPEHNGLDACAGAGVTLAPAPSGPDDRLRSGPRVGVSRGATRPWRFWLADEPSVSSYRRAAVRESARQTRSEGTA